MFRLWNKTIGRVLVAMVAALAMLITGVNLAPVANASDGAYNPDAPAVQVTSGVTVTVYKDKDHTEKFDQDKDKADIGQTFYGQISFDFTDEQKPTLGSPNRSYTFPSNIKVKDKESSTLYDGDGNVAGTWEIKGEVATAHWNEDWLTKHPSDISSYVSFDFTLGENAGGDDDKEHIVFPGGGGDITITIDKSKVSGKKDYKLNADGTVTFTVTLEPQFAVKNMVVTDTMGSNFTFVPGSFQLDGKDVTAQVDGQKATINLGDLGKAGKDGYQLTYKAELTDAAKKLLAQGDKLSDAQNTAQWTWNGADEPGKADVTPDFTYKMVEKSDGSGTANDIKWTVKLNTGSIKADMGNYTFTDTLDGGQHYIGSYEVQNADGDTVAKGQLDGSVKNFSYTFPANAGAQSYTIEYHTALDNEESPAKVNNTATVIPPDDNHPGGSDDGSFKPGNSKTYIEKKLDSSASTNAQGRATWTSTIYTSRMPAGTDPTTLEFADNTGSAADNVHSKPEGATFTFEDKPTFTLNGTTLVEGTDYEYTRDFTDTSFNVRFKGDTVKAAFGIRDITVTYATICNKVPGAYTNRSVVKFGDHPSQGFNATDTIEKTNLVSKTGSMKWDKDFDWSKIDENDTAKGAWVATWQVQVNEDNDPDNHHGQVDTQGKPLVVTETLPQGMSYVPGGTYDIEAGLNPPKLKKQDLDATITQHQGGTIVFTIPTDKLMQNDYYDKAFATLTYQTAAKGTGQQVSFTNTASASTGNTSLGSDSATVDGEHEVIDKSAAQIKDLNHVRYTIKVNPEGADIVKDSDALTLTDVMDAEGTFIPSSLKITNPVTGATLVVPTKVERVADADGNPTTKLTLTLPDSTPVTVVYDVKPNGKSGDTVNLSNTATLEGVAGGESINEKNWTVTNPSAGTEGAAGTITVTKTDASDLSRTLPGAEFALYKVDMGEISGTKVTFDQIKAAANKVGDNVTTDTNGVATFGSASSPLETNALYYFVETVAPKEADGVEYELDPDPTYFMLPGTDAHESSAALAKARGFGLPVSDAASYNVYDKRKPKPAVGSVTLGKQLTGRAWKDSDAFTFNLAADTTNSKGVTAGEIEAAMPKTTTATATKTGSGEDGDISKFTFGDFTFSKAGTYAYRVKETGKDGNGVTLDNRTATVTFDVEEDASGNLTVKGGQPTIAGIDDHNGDWAFTNTYKPTPVTTSGTIKVQKDLSGRAWKQGDSFEFRLAPTKQNPNAPLPAGVDNGYAALTVTDGEVHAFGDITYTKAGIYKYNLYEHTPTANDGEHAIPGIDYSNALYHVTVRVTDDGNGKLSIDSKNGVVVTKASNDDGSDYKNPDKPVAFNKAWFTNYFNAESINFSLLATKKYEDKTGSKPLTDGMFSFTLTADDNAPMPGGAKGGSVTAAAESDGTVSFPSIRYTGSNDDGKTYTYTLKENVPKGATVSADGKTATLNGMTYDLTAYTVKIALSTITDNDKPVLKQSVTMLDASGNKVDPAKLDNGRPVFSNTYQLTPVDASIAGQKTLTGRDMDENETFTFRLGAATDGTAEAKAASAGLKDDSIVLGSDTTKTTLETTVTNAKNGVPAEFAFNHLHFTKPGTFKFSVTEAGNVKQGTQKDEHVEYVTVKVVDNGQGGLKIGSIRYDNYTAKTEADKALTDKAGFTNIYEPEGYAFFLLHKKLTGVDGAAAPKLTAGKFRFGLYQGSGVDGKQPIQTRTNAAPVNGEVSGRIIFDRITYTLASLAKAVTDGYATYNAAAKTWTLTYTVAELDTDGKPVTASTAKKGGIAYDATTRKVIVTVKDAGNGTLHTEYIVSDGNPSTSTEAQSEEAAFDNVYTPASAAVELHARKTLRGRNWQNGDSFTFKLEAVDGKLTADGATVAKTDIPMPAGAQNGVLTHDVTDGNVFDFGQMTYTKPGTYTYNISEVQPSATEALPGVSYSSDLYRATVTVADDGKGQLTAKASMELVSKINPGSAKQDKAVKTDPATGGPVAEITNIYAKLSQNWSPKVYKSYADLSGRNPLVAGKFDFRLIPVDGAPLHVLGTGGKVTEAKELKAQNAANGEAAFKDVQFTDADLAANGGAKTYRYEISEVKGSEAGMTYDGTVYTVDVTVAMDANGYLTVTPTFKDENGRPVSADKISAGRPVFTNTYKPTLVATRLKAHKTLNGTTLADGQFSFQLYDGQQTGDGDQTKLLQTKTNDANGDVTFDKLDFDTTGTHTYSIREVVPADAVNDTKDGITYDHTWQYVQVKVTLDKETGALKTAVTDANTNSDTANFTNTYNAYGAATLTAKKEFRNEDGSARPILENDFTFQLHEGKTPTGKLLQTKPAKTDGSVTFEPIAYRLSDLGGMKAKTFAYTVNEVVPSDKDKLPGVAYDTTAHTYTVTVTDNGKGKLTTKVTVDGNANEQQPTFTNTYSAEGSAKLSGVKRVTGEDGRDYTAVFAGKFGFTLTGKDGAPIRVAGTGADAGKLVAKDSLTATNAADGGVSFDDLHYTLADLGGARSRDFTYVVAEASKTVAGVTNDASATREVTVSVSDDGSGRLSAVVKHEKDQPSFTFTNTYAAGGSLTLTGTKTLTGRRLTDADRFTFTVYEGYQSADKPGTPVATGTSDKTGRIAFDKPLQYTLKDLGEHTYTVVESEAGLPKGVSAVTKTRTFTVNVTDERHDGRLTVTATGLGEGNSVSFENAYTATDSAPVGFRGVKLLDGAPIADFDGRFTFTLTGEQGAPMPDKAKDGRLSVTNDKTGNVDFGTVTFTKADLDGETEKTFTYTVTESGSAPGVTNDATTTRTFTVTLRDNGDGTLSATASPAEGPLFTFTNTYSAKSTTDSFSFTKTLNGRDLQDGEFTFVLDAKDDAPMPRSATATNNADGRIAFGPITYDKPGTYTYTVREQSGDETGVTYDDATYVVTVTVTDHGDGTLSATHTVADANGKTVSQPTFVNTYTPPATPPDTPQPTPVTVNFDARKTLNGRDLRDGEFTFVLRDADGKTLQSAANTADGTIVFQPITYTEAGTWRYEITETAGDATGVTYDRTTYKVTVTVTDDGNGKLTANVAYSSGFLGLDRKTPEFVNTYTPPATPPDTPEEPGKPEQPETPGTPERPTTPGQPTQPTQPTDQSHPKTPLSQTGAATSSIMAAFTALLGCGLALGMIRLHGTIARSTRKSKGRHAQ